MRNQNLRLFMKMKRVSRSFVGGNNPKFTYLLRDERPCDVGFEKIGTYSGNCGVQSIDPRNKEDIGHHFNPRFVVVLSEVIIEPQQGLVYSLGGELVAESTVWPLFQLYYSFPWKPKHITRVIDVGESILVTSNAYGHWLAEDLGSIIHLVSNFPDAKILVSKSAPKYVRDFLSIIDKDFIELEGPARVKNLLFVSKSQDSGWMHPKDVTEIRNFSMFKKAFHQGQAQNSVYATRRNTKRSPRNEKLIEAEFQKNGFEVVALEELNFMDEVKLLAETKYFAGVHGSAHVNSIFMPEGASLLDIVNENYWTELGPRIADIRRQRYIPIIFAGTPLDPVNLELIRQGIETLELE